MKPLTPTSLEDRPAFLVTIDTEGDNMWSRPRKILTENSRYLPRFQSLCERYGVRPTWLTNHEMAQCPVFVEFARDVIARDAGEVGVHLHAWNSPPDYRLTDDDFQYQPYLIEYPRDIVREKFKRLVDLLETEFERKMVSHRAGRWALDEHYCRVLVDHGILVDCSVTPHVSWKRSLGVPSGSGGCDYRGFPPRAYFMDLENLHLPGDSPLLQVPMTIRPSRFAGSGRIVRRLMESLPLRQARGLGQFLCPEVRWLRPGRRGSAASMKKLVAESRDHAEFMLHSSEFMPGGSPRFPTRNSIESLYDSLEKLFEFVSERCVGLTLNEYHGRVVSSAVSDPGS